MKTIKQSRMGGGWNPIMRGMAGVVAGLALATTAVPVLAVNDIFSGVVTNVGSYLPSGSGNSLLVTNGAVVTSGQTIIGFGGNNNTAIVTGASSVWTNGPTSYFWVGYGGASSSNNVVLIRDGGKMVSTPTANFAVIGQDSVADANRVIVSGAGSSWHVAQTIAVGGNTSGGGSDNQLIVTNGGVVTSDSSFVGYGSGALNNQAVITGDGSIWSIAGAGQYLRIGSNDVSQGTGRVLVENGGTLEVNELRTGFNGTGTVTNRGGVLQFTAPYPILFANTANSIVSQDGTISFRGIVNAPTAIGGTALTNIAFQGNTGLQLNGASNAFVSSYTFNTGSPTNYQQLTLANGGLWRSDALAIGSGGALDGNGTIASASVTNNGVIAPGFSPGLLTFTSNLVLGSTSDLQMEIGGANPADYDRLIVGGSLTLTGALHVTTLSGYAAPVGTVFTLIDGAVPSTGQFAGLTNGAFIDAGSSFFNIEYNYSGNDVVLIATVPEPSTLALLSLTAALLIRRRR